MKKFRAFAAILALCLFCGCFTGCSELLFGVNVTVVNDSNTICTIKYTHEGCPATSDDEFETVLELKPGNEIGIEVEYGTRIRIIPEYAYASSLRTYTSRNIYTNETFYVTDCCYYY